MTQLKIRSQRTTAHKRGKTIMADEKTVAAVNETTTTVNALPPIIPVALDDVEVDETFNVRQTYTETVAADSNDPDGDSTDPKVEVKKPARRTLSEEESIAKLAASIRLNGQLTPVVVVRAKAAGKYKLVAGFRRMKALRLIEKEARKEGGKTVDPVMVRAQLKEGMSEEDAHYLNVSENIERAELTPFDIAVKARFMRDTFGAKGATIAERFGLTDRNYVNNLMRALDKLHPDIAAEWKAGHPAATHNFLFSLLTKEQDAQWEKWQYRIGALSDDEEESDDDDSDGDDKGSDKGGDETESATTRRPAVSTLEAAIEAIKANDEKSDDYKAGAVAALKFAAGLAPRIPGVYDPKKAQAQKGGKKDKGKRAEA